MGTISNRLYKVSFNSSDGIEVSTVSFSTLISESDDRELIYSMQDVTDEILDLKIGDSMYFRPNRDDAQSKGLIVRIV